MDGAIDKLVEQLKNAGVARVKMALVLDIKLTGLKPRLQSLLDGENSISHWFH